MGGKRQQQVMMVVKRRLGGVMVMEDEMGLQLKVEYGMVALVLPLVEGEE